MKLSTRDLQRFLTRPDPECPAILLYGADAMRVALKRKALVEALIGPDGADDMRLTRLDPGSLRRDPAALADALRARGFFGGPRAVLIDSAPDPVAKVIASALDDSAAEDATLVVTAGALTRGSALRKLFEGHAKARAAAIYDDPPTAAEVDEVLARAGLAAVPPAARDDLMSLAQGLDPGDFAQFAEKLAIYKHGDQTPLDPTDIAAVAPQSSEAALDDLLGVVAEGQTGAVAPLVRRLRAQGVSATAVCLGAGRHFKALHAIATHPGGVSSGVAAVRPPLFGPRRDRMKRQAGALGVSRIEDAMALILDADRALRGAASQVPADALVERMLLRVTFLARR